MDPFSILAGITGVGTMLGGFSANKQNASNNAAQLAFQKDAFNRSLDYDKYKTDLAYQREVDMWNKANEYNSAAAQMSRLAEAGLNPNLAYGQLSGGNASAPAISAGSVPSAPSASLSKIDNPMSGFAQAVSSAADVIFRNRQLDINQNLGDAQVQSYQAQSKYYNELAAKTNIEAQRSMNFYDIERKTKAYRITLESMGVDEKRAEIEAKKFQAKLLESQVTHMGFVNEILEKTKSDRINNAFLTNLELEARIAEIKSKKNLNDADRAQIQVLTSLLYDERKLRDEYPDLFKGVWRGENKRRYFESKYFGLKHMYDDKIENSSLFGHSAYRFGTGLQNMFGKISPGVFIP